MAVHILSESLPKDVHQGWDREPTAAVEHLY